jgi:hypothetical protein
LIGSLCKFIGLFAVIFFVVVFWQPITALFKFYRDGIYETSSGNKVKRFPTVQPKRIEEYTRRTG